MAIFNFIFICLLLTGIQSKCVCSLFYTRANRKARRPRPHPVFVFREPLREAGPVLEVALLQAEQALQLLSSFFLKPLSRSSQQGASTWQEMTHILHWLLQPLQRLVQPRAVGAPAFPSSARTGNPRAKVLPLRRSTARLSSGNPARASIRSPGQAAPRSGGIPGAGARSAALVAEL